MKLNSLYNHVRFSFLNKRKLEKPKVIQFPVIDICNSRCQMCRIWENKVSKDISIEDLKVGLKSGLFDEVEAIGFNGGEPTLRADLPILVGTVLEYLPSLKSVSLITNAFKTVQVKKQIDEISKITKNYQVKLDVMVSLDGYGEVHDKVRGRSGSFENAIKVIEHISENPSVTSIRVGCTVIKENVNNLPDLLEFCIKNGLYIKFRLGIPHQRLYTQNLLDPYALSFEEKYEFVEFLEGVLEHYETGHSQRLFYRSLIEQLVYNKPRSAGCDWKHRGATITAKGELAFCAVQSKAILDNVGQGDPELAYFSNQNYLNNLVEKHCDKCNHDYVGIPSSDVYRRLMMTRLNDKFKIKEKLKIIPHFNVLNTIRNKNRFVKSLDSYRTISPLVNNERLDVKTVLICGWYGTETLGDKAIIGGVMSSFRKLLGDNTKFIVVALNPYISEMTRLQMPEFRNTSIVDPKEGIENINKADFVVFGGGPLMAIDALAPMQIIFEKARSKGITTVVAGCGVGPLGADWHNESIKTILSLADHRIYRDARSANYAQELGVDVSLDIVSEDPAFSWLVHLESSEKQSSFFQERTTEVLLLGLRDFPYVQYAKHLNESKAISIRDNYEYVLVEALKRLVEKRPHLKIRPLPMCTNHYGSDDRWFYRKLFRDVAELNKHLDMSLLGSERAPDFYCDAIKDADALLAMRFHSVVFGIALGTNTVALDYTLGKGKVQSLGDKFDITLLSMLNLEIESLLESIEVALNTQKKQPLKGQDLTFESALKAMIIKEA